MPDDKTDKVLDLQPTGSHVVTLTGDEFQGHGVTQLVVAPLHDG